MHSFLINMCRSCLTTNVHLKKYMVVEDKKITCFDAVKIILPNSMVPVNFGYGYSLCEVCIDLLKSTAKFQRRLSESHNAYSKYMETFNFSNDYKLSVPICQHINKEGLPMLKTDKESRVNQTEITCNQISTNNTIQDILNDEDLNCDTYNDNSLGEPDSMIGIKEYVLVTTSEEACNNIDNVISDSINMYDKQVVIADNGNHNQMDFSLEENILCVRNIKEEHENLISEGINRINKDVPMSDNGSCYQLNIKVEVGEQEIAPRESKKEHDEHFEMIYACETRSENEILANNLPATDFKQEKTINRKAETLPIILSKHKVDSKKKWPYNCDFCEKSFSHKTSLIAHKRIHTGERPYKCDICEKSFNQNANLIRHKRTHTGEQPYKCDFCEKSFPHKSALITHTRIHTGERPYKCDVCEKSFSYKHSLILHKHIHTAERPYKCDVCEKSFSLKSHLITHTRIHTGERPYKCDVCEKSFVQIPGLNRHKRIHTGEKPYECHVCESRFSDGSTLLRHKSMHTKERPYKCEVCEKSFNRIGALNLHKRIHTGERPYKCDVCEMSFSQKTVLIRHKRVHTGERPYKCDVCKKSFAEKISLIKHKRIHT